MKVSRLFLPLAAFLIAVTSLKADVLVLKNGEKKEGTILEERPDAVKMNYIVVGKIMEVKEFPRSDIAQVIKQKPEEVEIVQMRKTVPTPDLLTADQYEQIIQDRLRPFVNKYPGTPQAKEIEEMIAELQKEKERVIAGEVKLENQWLNAETAKADQYNIEAYRIRRSMQEKANAGDYVGALREFDRLGNPDGGYPGSMQYVKAVPEAIEILKKYEALISRMVSEQPVLQKQRDESLKKMVEPDLGRANAAIEKTKSEWAATYDAEKKAKVRWQTLYKYDLKSLQDALKVAGGERGRLQLLDMAKLQAQNEAFTKALHALAAGNVTEAEAALKISQAVGMKDSSKIFTTVRSRISALRTEQLRQKRTNQAAAGSSAVGGGTTAETDDRVKKAMEEAEQKKTADKTPDGEKADGEAKPDGETKAETGKKESKFKPKVTNKKEKPASDAPAVVVPVEEESNTQTYLLIGAGILVVVLLAAFLMQKKKS